MSMKPAHVITVLLLLAAATATAQETFVVLDENDVEGADYREASFGSFEAPDSLQLVDGVKLPVERDRAYSGETSGRLAYRHAGGSWQMTVAAEEAFNTAGFDSLTVYLNGPAAMSGKELPRVSLLDELGGQTRPVWLSPVRNVGVDGSGFTAESRTNAVLAAEYVNVRPAGERRHGYPEDLTITFANEPLDTSEAYIGVPARPAHFEITTAGGFRPVFRFHDLDGDGTLSRADEYVDVRFPETEGSSTWITTWRLTLASTGGPEPLDPPGEGDVFQLDVTFEELTLDADPETWQRLSLPVDEMTADGDFDPVHVASVVFEHGGPTDTVRTLWFDRLVLRKNDDTPFLDLIQERTFQYFWQEANPSNGLVKDRSTATSPSSIAAVGFGLSALTVGIDREWISREQGRERVAATLRFFWNAPQSTAVDATGYKGFFYHFLDMQTGRRVWNSELSTIDTALLLAGVLHAGAYFDGADAVEEEIRSLADSIYRRVDFAWMQRRGSSAISHGWRPETGFIEHDWLGYNEAMILYVLALGSPTHPAGEDAWAAWVSGYERQWRTEYGYTYLTFPPLFGHQYSHVWIDFRGIQDAYMRETGIDYFENSRRATLAQRAYHVHNPRGYPNYGLNEWGLTASDTPDGYRARGAPPPQNDDGTLVPTAPGGSVVFTPDESIAALRTMYDKYADRLWGPYGFRDAYNVERDWFDDQYIGIDQGPILLMIENYRTERIWNLMMELEVVQRGLLKAGFEGTPLSSGREPPDAAFELHVYPNPSVRTVHLAFSLEAAGEIELSIYDVLGRRVEQVAAGFRTVGRHRLEADLSGLSSGTYFIVLDASERRAARPLSVLR